VPVIVDAFLRGFKGVDWNEAYAQICETLRKSHPSRRKENWDVLDRYGYYPFDLIRAEGVSRLLECSFDDWCAARMAEKLGKREDAAFFDSRAWGWTNVFDSAVGYVRGRRSDGAWRTPFDPCKVNHNHGGTGDFTEGNAAQWTWHVLHNPKGLIEAMGGEKAALKKLDELFAADSRLTGSECKVDVTGLIGQYAHGNEPSHHIPFLYALCGRADLAHARAVEICEKFYRPTPDGLAGNDDCGQMSAWLIFAALGRYPVTPCGTEGMVSFPGVYPGVKISLKEDPK
jgi:predicted alpha-1,2-mannosidase